MTNANNKEFTVGQEITFYEKLACDEYRKNSEGKYKKVRTGFLYPSGEFKFQIRKIVEADNVLVIKRLDIDGMFICHPKMLGKAIAL